MTLYSKHRDKLKSLYFSRFVARKSGGGTIYLLAVFEIIACKEACFTTACSSTCTPSSPFYKLPEIERRKLTNSGPLRESADKHSIYSCKARRSMYSSL